MRAVRGYQIFFALVYAACIALAVSGISFNMQCGEDDGPPYQAYYQFSQQSFRIYVPLGLLALGSTLHVMPEGAPFSYLLWWFRVGMIFQFGVQIFDFYAVSGMCHDGKKSGGGGSSGGGGGLGGMGGAEGANCK